MEEKKKRKGKNVYLKSESGAPVLKKSWKKVSIGIIAAAILLCTALVIAFPSLEVAMISLMVSTLVTMFGGAAIINESDDTRPFEKRLKRFVRAELADRRSPYRSSHSVINAIMNCTYHANAGSDEKGNCVDCKFAYGQIVTPELNDYVQATLDKVVAEVEKEEREELFKEKQRELKLNSAGQNALVAHFADTANFTELKRSKESMKALREITEADISSSRRDMLTSFSTAGDTAAQAWDKEFQR